MRLKKKTLDELKTLEELNENKKKKLLNLISKLIIKIIITNHSQLKE